MDADRRTDIEVSSAAGKVCIEIKPVGSNFIYTANSLTGTLRNQLVAQYLKGQNSKHGALVLFRLDRKKWEIPGQKKYREFEDLVKYLEVQASRIMAENDQVDRLLVFGIDCVGIKE